MQLRDACQQPISMIIITNFLLFFSLMILSQKAIFAPFMITSFMSFVAWGNGRTLPEIKAQLKAVSAFVHILLNLTALKTAFGLQLEHL